MRLLIIMEYNPFFRNAASANRWRSLIEGLNGLGSEIHLLITEGFHNRKEYDQFGKKGQYKGVTYEYLDSQVYDSIWKKRWNQYVKVPLTKNLKIKKLVGRLRKNEEALIWTSASLMGFQLAYQIKKQVPNARTLLEMSEYLDIHQHNQGNALHRKRGDDRKDFFETKGLYAYDGLALMTKTLYQHYEAFPGQLPRLLHLPMTVDLDRFSDQKKLLPGLSRPYIAFIGAMNNRKDGVDLLIDAFHAIAQDFPAYHLYLFGFYHYDTPGHLEQIKRYGLEDRVFYKGEIDRDEVTSVIQNASLLVLPRPASKQAQGGFPTKLGEYLATGNPVCATTVGEIPQYLEDGESVFFAEPGSADSFASAMRRALSNPDLARRVGANGRQVAEKHFNKDIQAKTLYNFLNELTIG